MAKWRIVYVRNLGEKVIGRGRKDAFKFMDETNNTLGATYVAFLVARESENEPGIVICQIRVKYNKIYLLDNEGEYIADPNVYLGQNIFKIWLKDHDPSIKEFFIFMRDTWPEDKRKDHNKYVERWS